MSKKKIKKDENEEIENKFNDIDALTNEYMDLDKNFEDIFPHLAKEMNISTSKISMRGIRWSEELEKDREEMNELINPDIISFIRRCSTNGEAIEIIEFMLLRGEIEENYAQKLKDQLKIQGLESFGSKKTPGYYEKKFRK